MSFQKNEAEPDQPEHGIPENGWEWIEERAAIMEIDGGINRDEANHRAFMLWYSQFIERKLTQ